MSYVRYLWSIKRILEDTIRDDIKGRCIANFAIKAMKNVNLDPIMCCLQTYDGARNVSGKQSSAIKKKLIKLHIFTVCPTRVYQSF